MDTLTVRTTPPPITTNSFLDIFAYSNWQLKTTHCVIWYSHSDDFNEDLISSWASKLLGPTRHSSLDPFPDVFKNSLFGMTKISLKAKIPPKACLTLNVQGRLNTLIFPLLNLRFIVNRAICHVNLLSRSRRIRVQNFPYSLRLHHSCITE